MSNIPSGTISIAATFTAEPLVPALSFMLEQAGIQLDVCFAPYNQVFQQLLSDSSLLLNNRRGINVILVRTEDFIRDTPDDATGVATVTHGAEELNKALASFAARTTVTTIVAMFPPSPRANQFGLALNAANEKLAAQISTLPGMLLLSTKDIERLMDGDAFDDVSDELAHVPFTRTFYASLAAAIVRKTHAALVPAHKVLVLDCDNTLWRGVVGEDGVENIAITPAFAELQEFAVQMHSNGVLVCLVSKNSEGDVLDVFDRRSDMLLKIDHIVAHRINWEPKPQNVLSLAKQLNLGLESFVFIDDNPVECALIRAELPQLVTLQVPPEEEIRSFLTNLWTFDKIAVTDEDQRRTQMYKEDAARTASEAQAVNITDFIESLDVRVNIDVPNDREWSRLAQLTQRTNQFNFTTKRRSESELRALASKGASVLRINVEDRFGDYGLVGLVVAEFATDRINVDTLLLSCRVLGRGVEHAIVRELGNLAINRELPYVKIPFYPTSRNEPAGAFIDSVASQFRAPEGRNAIYLVPSLEAASIQHRPGFDPEAVFEASRPSKEWGMSVGSVSAPRSDRYERLAKHLISGQAINVAANPKATRSRMLTNPASAATNECERRLLNVWEDTLAIADLGIDDDYFALGGSSLAAANLFAEITRQFGVKLPLTTVLSAPTVRTLAHHIAGKAVDANGPLIELKGGSLRNLFLVHDGDGETLLYSNIARRMPSDVAVYGVNPQTKPNIPLAHTRIEDMASYYVDQIRDKQPRGPYLLGGMCAGGVIAYEMASQLLRRGEAVELVLLLDAATPQAILRPHLAAKSRLQRFSQTIKDKRNSRAPFFDRGRKLIVVAFQKTWNLLRWEATSRLNMWSVFFAISTAQPAVEAPEAVAQ